MVEKLPGASRGLLKSLTALSGTLVAMAYTRLDLLSLEIDEALEHASKLLVLAVTGLFCCGVGVVLASILVVLAFWDTHRLLALGVLAGFFLAIAVVSTIVLVRKMSSAPKLFASSLAELFKDRQHLVSRS